MEYDLTCLFCEAQTIVEIIEYGSTEVECSCCKEKQNVLYSEDCDDNYNDCWDTYWVEELE